MKDKKIQALSDSEFHRLASEQTRLFPDLLMFGTEENIINDFYDYYGRKKDLRVKDSN
jgi:hypothetical protein